MNRRWVLCALGAACAAMLAVTAVFVPFQPHAGPGHATDAEPSLPQQVLAAFGGAEAPAEAASEAEAAGILRDTAALLGAPGPMRSYGDLLRAAHAAPSSPLPIPAAPAGPEPLASALATYLGAVDAPLPPPADLRAAIDRLRLTPEGEGALARLVLAYVEALGSQQRAVSGLSATELEDLAGLHGEAPAMAAAQKVDPAAMLESADLLLRAALETEPLLRERRAAEAVLADVDLDLLGALLPPPQPVAATTLRAALDQLARSEGASMPDAAPAVMLPPSLDAALAGLVAAKATAADDPGGLGAARILAAVKDAEPTLRAWQQLLAPAQDGMPAVQQMQSLLSAATGADPAAVAAAGLGADAAAPATVPDLAAALRAVGLPEADAATAASSLPPGARAALATLLAAESALAAARQPLASLTAAQQTALLDTEAVARLLSAARWNATEADRVLAWAQAAAAAQALAPSLRQAQADAAAAVQRAALLAGTSQAPVGGAPQAPAPGLAPPPTSQAASTCVATPFSDCANDVLLALPAAGGILVTGSGSTRIDGRFAGGEPHIVIDLGGDDENLLASGAADGGIGIPDSAVTGTIGLPGAPGSVYLPDSQSLDDAQQNVQRGRTFAVTLDVGGDDRYASGRALAQGSASGIGAVGILWDAAGDDNYTQLADPTTGDQAGQGAGVKGGLGLLVDLAGADLYAAPAATAQGVGTSPIPPFSVAACGLAVCVLGAGPDAQSFMAGTGALLDLGDGADRFQAQGGQGHSAGLGTVGVLADLQGNTSYAVSNPDPAFQGGRGGTTSAATVSGLAIPALQPGGLALLLDLGGPGDTYTSPPVPQDGNSSILRPPGQPPRKADHAIWADKEHGLALGIDSSLSDQDGDRVPDLAELLAGSDPEKAASVMPNPAAAIDLVSRVLGSVVPQAKDGDGDRFPDQVEQAWGSDPQDPASTPGLGAGFVSLGSQCPADAPDECGAEGACDPKQFACMSLFALGSPEAETVTRAAVVAIDLGGNDHYQATVAGPGTKDLRGALLVDAGGNDEYGGEGARLTQAASLGGAAVLVDLQGNDRYVAASKAQAYAEGSGVAVLLDRDGNDRYQAATQALAFLADDAAPGSEPSLALLLDGHGADRYVFQTQATVRGPPRDAQAILLDVLGLDRYTSLAPPADLASGGQAPATPYESQGRLERAPGAVGGSRLSLGLFADIGVDQDQYFVTGADGQLSRSAVKDSAGIVRNAARGPSGPDAGDGGTADALFVDGLHEAGQDDDGDSIPSLLEAALGSDPSDAASVPANAGDQALRLRPSLGLAGSLGDDLRLPGLLVSAQAASVHDESFPFLVDLGGDDRYVAPNVGGASALSGHVRGSGSVRFATTLLLDVGDGTDVYAPEPCVQRRESGDDLVLLEERGSVPDGQGAVLDTPEGTLVAHCPSLGGAVGGVAVLADAGGRNTFNASIDLGVRTVASPGRDPQAVVHAWTVTQGAALFHGVGVLATKGTRNDFVASATARATEAEEAAPTPQAQAVTLAQGAAWGHGAGILLSLGQGDDNYTADAAASAPRANGDAGVAANVAQGAAMAGQGVLVDDGGDNLFSARQGLAQAAAFNLPDGFLLPQVGGPVSRTPSPGEATQANPTALVASQDLAQAATPVAVLWSGPGNDTFLAGPASQAAAGMYTRNGGLALLVEDGGDDVYRVAGASLPATGACKGSPSCAFGQAAAESNARAVLLDLAGDDQYDAAGLAHSQSAGNGSALLADLGGNDRYVAGPASQAMDQAVFLDAAGHDAYTLGDTGYGIGFFGDGEGRDVYDNEPFDELDWRHDYSPLPHVDVTGADGAGLFLDANSFDVVLDAYRTQAAQDTPVHAFAARDPDGDDRLAEGAVAGGKLYLVAEVPSDRADAVQRVGFLLDGRQLGTAHRAGTADGVARYVLAWDTGQGTDGAYALQATAFLGSSKVPGAAPRPDGMPVPSDEFHVAIDNGPAGQASLSAPAFSPTQPATHPTLTVRPARDLSGTVHLAARMVGAGQDVTLVDEQVPAGVAFAAVLDGACGAGACPDGAYEVKVTIADATGAVALPALPVLVDGTPPTAELTVPGFSGAGRQAGPGRLEVTWAAQDAGSGLGTATVTATNLTGAPIAKVSVPAGLGRASVPAGDGQTLLLSLNVTDGLGNADDPCGGTPLGCPDAANTTADFRDPHAGALALSATLVGPGRQVNATLAPTDDDTWIARAVATLTGAEDQSVELAPDGDNWTASIGFAPAFAGEAPFLVRADVFDAAGNQAQSPMASGVLDTLRPRLGAPAVSYLSQVGGPVGSGRPGTLAVAQLDVTEHALASVRLDAAALGLGDIGCERDGEPALTASWRCEALIPDVADGHYALAVRARDLAGNPENSTPVEVVVDARSANITALRLADAGPDFLEVAWLTAQPATSRVLYGTTELHDAVDDAALTTSHRLRIAGLQPRTNYTLQVASTTAAGVVAASNVTRYATTSAFELLLPDLAGPWQGQQRVQVDLRQTMGSGPFQFSLRLVPDDPHLAPFVALAKTLPAGPTPLQLDTTVLPDGEYLAIASASRAQDSHSVQQRIRIDNVAPIVVPKAPMPGAVTPQPRPWLQVHVNDPGQSNGFTARVRLLVDGAPADFEGLQVNKTAFPFTVVLRPVQPLPEGPRSITIQVLDEAGNVGETTWPFRVDLSAPDPTRGPVVAEGRPVRPGADADLVVDLQDVAGVAKAVLEVDSKTNVSLASNGDGTWQGRFRVPSNLTDGVAELRLRVTDAFGTNGTLAVRLVVDSLAPLLLEAKAESQGHTMALVRAGTNEAAVLSVQLGNRSVASTVGQRHILLVPGLVPGVVNRLLVNATDLAGNPSTLTLFVTPPADGFPPTSVRELRAVSDEEGKVDLDWVAAGDNVGLKAYQLTRVVAGLSSVVTLPAGQTSFEDAASPGTEVTYSVRAVDVGGNPGPSVSVRQSVLSVPHVANLTIDPATGPADRPFTVRVEFRTASGAAPDRIEVRLGEQRFALHRAGVDDDCRTSCAYEAQVRLPPTSALDPQQQLVAEALSGEATASASAPAPLVTAGSGAGARVGGHGAPGLPLAWSLLVLAAWCLARRRAA